MNANGRNDTGKDTAADAGQRMKGLPSAARRALKEAEERRRRKAHEPAMPAEVGGRRGPEPTRYGDWEKDGIVSDF